MQPGIGTRGRAVYLPSHLPMAYETLSAPKPEGTATEPRVSLSLRLIPETDGKSWMLWVPRGASEGRSCLSGPASPGPQGYSPHFMALKEPERLCAGLLPYSPGWQNASWDVPGTLLHLKGTWGVVPCEAGGSNIPRITTDCCMPATCQALACVP